MSDIKQQLKEMARLSLLANRISETHERNLKYFPFIFFDGIKNVKIDYDLGHTIKEATKEVHHDSRVSYYLTINDKVVNSNLEYRFKSLEVAVRELFWKDIKVQIYFNDQLSYESKDV